MLFGVVAALAALSRSIAVIVSGEGIVATSTSAGDTWAGVRISTDGFIYRIDKVDGGATTYTKIDTGTDWVLPRPPSGAKTYHVKATEDDKVEGGFEVGTLATWLAISSDRDWYMVRKNVAGNGTSTWDLTIHLSEDGGTTTLDTGPFLCDAVRNVP